jgi:hypothetical protein
MFNRYDENKSGRLEKDEWSKMRSSYANADANKDGVITRQELTQHLGNRDGGSSSSGGGSGGGGSGRGFSNGGSSPDSSRTASSGERGRGEDRSGERSSSGRDNRGGSGRGGRSDSTARSTTKASYRFKSADERIAAVLSGSSREWFLKTDADNDGQVSMAEYASSWDDEKVSEFQGIDTNQDGLLTPDEYKSSGKGS